MRRTMIAAAALLALSGGARGDDDLAAIASRKIGEALAIDAKCGRLRIDEMLIAATVMKSGLRMEPLMPEAYVVAKDLVSSFQPEPEETVCKIGDLLYGPSGTNAPDFLIPE